MPLFDHKEFNDRKTITMKDFFKGDFDQEEYFHEPSKKKIKVRLVKVLVKPVFILDYGDKLEEVNHDTIEISAQDWPPYSSDKFPHQVKQWEEKLNSVDS